MRDMIGRLFFDPDKKLGEHRCVLRDKGSEPKQDPGDEESQRKRPRQDPNNQWYGKHKWNSSGSSDWNGNGWNNHGWRGKWHRDICDYFGCDDDEYFRDTYKADELARTRVKDLDYNISRVPLLDTTDGWRADKGRDPTRVFETPESSHMTCSVSLRGSSLPAQASST